MSERAKTVNNTKIEGFTVFSLPSSFFLAVFVSVGVYGSNSFSDNQMGNYFPKLGKG